MHSSLLRVAIGVFALLFSFAAQAIPIRTYGLDITLNCIASTSGPDPSCRDELGGVHAGTTYTAHMSFAEDVFATDGYINAPLESFYFALAETVWDSNHPNCSVVIDESSGFCGVRHLNSPDIPGDEGLTLHIANHEIVGLCCGVFGGLDIPFIDLVSTFPDLNGPTTAYVTALYHESPGPQGRRLLSASGAVSIRQVSEPSVLALSIAGLLLLTGFRWRTGKDGGQCRD